MKSMHTLLNCEIGGFVCCVIALVHVIYSRVSGQYSHAIDSVFHDCFYFTL